MTKAYRKCPHEKDAPRYPNGWCKKCASARGKNPEVKAYQQKYQAAHKGDANIKATKARSKRKRAGVPEAPYSAPAFCECCSRPPGKVGLIRDHDHATGTFRGWLCSRCNLGIGLFGDSVDAMTLARIYLIRAELR